MPNEDAYLNCNFQGATMLARAWPNRSGVTVDLKSAGDRFYACSKICQSNGHRVRICAGGSSCGCSEGRTYEPTRIDNSPPAVVTTRAPTTRAPVAVDCVGDWLQWSDCEEGVKSRTFEVSTAAANGGRACSWRNQQSEVKTCGTACAGVWSDFSECAGEGGGMYGERRRTYTVTTEAADGGSSCGHADGAVDMQQCIMPTTTTPQDPAEPEKSTINTSVPVQNGAAQEERPVNESRAETSQQQDPSTTLQQSSSLEMSTARRKSVRLKPIVDVRMPIGMTLTELARHVTWVQAICDGITVSLSMPTADCRVTGIREIYERRSRKLLESKEKKNLFTECDF